MIARVCGWMGGPCVCVGMGDGRCTAHVRRAASFVNSGAGGRVRCSEVNYVHGMHARRQSSRAGGERGRGTSACNWRQRHTFKNHHECTVVSDNVAVIRWRYYSHPTSPLMLLQPPPPPQPPPPLPPPPPPLTTTGFPEYRKYSSRSSHPCRCQTTRRSAAATLPSNCIRSKLANIQYTETKQEINIKPTCHGTRAQTQYGQFVLSPSTLLPDLRPSLAQQCTPTLGSAKPQHDPRNRRAPHTFVTTSSCSVASLRSCSNPPAFRTYTCHDSINQSINQSISQSINQSINQFTVSVCQCLFHSLTRSLTRSLTH